MVLTDYIKLRDQLVNIGSMNNLFSTIAAGEAVPELSDASFQMQGIAMSYDSSNQLVNIKNTNDPLLVPLQFEVSEVVDHLDTVIPGTSYTVSDIFSTASSTGDLYTALSSVTQKYSYSERINVDTLRNIIDDTIPQSSSNYDVENLKNQLVAISDNEGYVTGRSWITALKDWIKSCKDGADDQSAELDNTAPTVLSSLYSIVSAVLSIALPVIFSALSVVFGALVSVISGLLSSLFSVVGDYLSDQVTFNINCPNHFVKGVMTAFEGSDGGVRNYTGNKYSIKYFDGATVGMFAWNAPNLSDIRMNSYLKPYYSPEKVSAYLYSLNGTVAGAGIYVTKNVYGLITDIEKNDWITSTNLQYCVLDENELAELDFNNDKYLAAILVSELVRQILCAPHKTPNSNHTGWEHCHWSGYYSSTTFPDTSLKLASMAVTVISNLGSSTPKYWNDNYTTRENVVDAIATYVSERYLRRSKYIDPDWIWQGNYNNNIVRYTGPTNPVYSRCTNSTRYAGCSGRWFTLTFDNENYQSDITEWGFEILSPLYVYDADSLPTSFFASFKAVNLDNVISFLILSSLATISAAFVTTKIAKTMRIKKIMKQTLRSNTLAKKRQDWENDPNNKTLLKEYAKEADKFNRLGKIFGWGSYDAANGWIDSSSGGSSIPNIIGNVVDAAKNSSLLKNSSTQEDYIQTIIQKLNTIISLIH